MKKQLYTFWLFTSFCITAICQDIIPPGKIKKQIDELVNDSSLQNASLGISVINLSTNQILLAYNSNQSLVPASTHKILTTAAALSILGPDYKYETKIEYDGFLDTTKGTLNGNIYIKGSGDPTLGSSYFINKTDTLSITKIWASILKQKGIKKITGAIIADAEVFEDDMLPPTWIWSDMGNYYGAGALGLNFMDNKYTVYLNSYDKGSQTKISKITPEIPGLELINNITAGGSGDNAFIFGAPYLYKRYANGTIPENRKNFDIEGSMPDPSLFCAYSLSESLKKMGVEIQGIPTTIKILKEKQSYKNQPKKILFSHYSPSLEKIVYYTNIKSNNVYAEALLKTLAIKKNKPGTTSAGCEVIKNYWKEKGVNINGLYIADGSGLSRFNTITTSIHVAVLQNIYSDFYYSTFNNSLPVAGKSGSLSTLCKGTHAENNMRAKSGYITRARSYAGYVKNKKGEELAFSLIVNNYNCTAKEMKLKMEQILVLISELE